MEENTANANENVLPTKSRASQDRKNVVFTAWRNKKAVGNIRKAFSAL